MIESLSPDAVGLEELYSHYERPQTAIIMGHARGVICLALNQKALNHVKLRGHADQKSLDGKRPGARKIRFSLPWPAI